MMVQCLLSSVVMVCAYSDDDWEFKLYVIIIVVVFEIVMDVFGKKN